MSNFGPRGRGFRSRVGRPPYRGRGGRGRFQPSDVCDQRFAQGPIPSAQETCPTVWPQLSGQYSFNQPNRYPRHRGAGGGWGKRKLFPQDAPFFCDPCFVGLYSQSEYDEHVKLHKQCDVPECKFAGIESALMKHKKNVHQIRPQQQQHNQSNVSKSWKDQRKRNFPTEQHVMEKKSQKTDAHSKGAVLESDVKFGKFEFVEGNKITDSASTSSRRQSQRLHAVGNKPQPHASTDISLLQKLLLNETREEHNVLLQCVRYIVEQNFFQ